MPPPVAQTKSAPRTNPFPPSAVQRVVKVKTGQNREGLLESLLRIDSRQARRLGRKTLDTCLEILEQSAEFHGTFDIYNEQMVALLYFQAVRLNLTATGGMAWDSTQKKLVFKDRNWHARRQGTEELLHRAKRRVAVLSKHLDIYQLAIIGAGSAAAYYIDTLGVAYDHRFTLLIGGPDPWAGQRGQGISFINHVASQINYPSSGVPDFSTKFVPRADFAAKTKAIIEDAIDIQNRFKGTIDKISHTRSGTYKIEWHDVAHGYTHYAAKVVVATGAGPHQLTDAKGLDTLGDRRNRVMDMDTFIRDIVPAAKDEDGAKTVVVQGPNAAIDAVAAAQLRRWHVHWIVRGTPPVYLPGTLYSLGRIPLYKGGRKGQDTVITISPAGEHVQVTGTNLRLCNAPNHQYMSADDLKKEQYWDVEAGKTFTADYFVYGIGQNANAEGAVGNFLKDLLPDLTPIHHRGGRYSEVRPEIGWRATKRLGADLAFKEGHAVGLGDQSGKLLVIGAAAKAVVKKDDAEKLNAVVKYQSADIVAYEQLGGIRSAMYGLNEHLPPDIAERVDFSHADPTVLRAHIALKYPNLAEEHATRIINQILSHRKTGHHPHGYDDWWQNHWKSNLAWWERNGRRG